MRNSGLDEAQTGIKIARTNINNLRYADDTTLTAESEEETYITICEIDNQWEFAVCLRKLKQGLCINLEGWRGEGDRREVQKGEDICIPMSDSC